MLDPFWVGHFSPRHGTASGCW